MRDAAVEILQRAERSMAPVDNVLQTALSCWSPRDRRLLHELVLGTVRWRRRLDDVLQQVADRKLRSIDKGLLWPFRVALYQLFFLDRMPTHAIVYEAVEQAERATHRGGASFTNAVLRRVARARRLSDWPVAAQEAVERLGTTYSYPNFLVRRWLERWGEPRTERLLTVCNQPKPMHLLAFRQCGGREALAERLIDEDVVVEPSDLSPCGLIVRSGKVLKGGSLRGEGLYVQDEVSQIAAWLPPPRTGERVLDLAAAPGGKSFALLAMQPLLDVYATDVSVPRMKRMADNARRLGLSEIRLAVEDALRPSIGGVFDRVVLDLPCSGTGTLRKNPEVRWRIRPEELNRLVREGRELAVRSAQRVAPGGVLVLITCSIEEEEVTEPMREVLERQPEFEPYPLHEHADPHVEAGRTEQPGLWQVLPEDDHDGFTVGVLRRRADGSNRSGNP